jgi:hypothetical protein
MQGKAYYSEQLFLDSDFETIPVTGSLTAGVYLVEVASGSSVFREKVVIK